MQFISKNLASYSLISLLTVASLSAPGAARGDATGSARHTFSFGGPDNSQFLLDGNPFQIIGGEMHPARIPREYWRHRIRMAKAMGINTIPIYVFWNQHEEEEGKFDFTTGERNIGEFMDIARQEGMWIVLRAGPYVCGEWDFGGLPWWLFRTPDIRLRSSDPRFTEPVARYYHELAKVVRPRLAANGGPILMVQIENEYGSYPRRDHAYELWLRDLWIKEGVNGPFFTADGAGEGNLKGIVIPGAAVGLDTGGSEGAFELAHRLNPGVPAMSAEVYPGWLRHWGEGNWGPTNVSGLIKFYMETHKSFSLYVFHGGTNFGFTAGKNGGDGDLTSYDYGAPLNEQGRPTPAYFAYRKQLASYLPPGKALPDVPAAIPTMSIPPFQLERWTGLWEQLPQPVLSDDPRHFEELGQNQGIVIYRTHIPAGGARHLSMPELRDYATVYVNGTLIQSKDPHGCDLPACSAEATLEVMVEAMGHINYSAEMDSDCKGLGERVTLAGTPLKHWETMCFPLKNGWIASLRKTTPIPGRIGGIFKGEFKLDSVADTYLDMSAWKKGVLWVNGRNLGRFWSIGPQQRLYCPAPWLKVGVNSIVVLDDEATEPQPVEGYGTPAGRLAGMGARVIQADSEDPIFPAKNAIDGDGNTIWQTVWTPKVAPLPHFLVIDMGRELSLKGVTCLPRQDIGNGRIAHCEIYCGNNPNAWGPPAATAVLPNTADLHRILFNQPVKGRYLKLTIQSEAHGDSFISLAELDIIPSAP